MCALFFKILPSHTVFCSVYRGAYNGTEVAIKVVRSMEEKSDLRLEIVCLFVVGGVVG
jgi:effector-binding domain-containing protein